MTLPASLRLALEQRTALKVISGILNTDPVRVGQVVRAATWGGATYVDIAAVPSLVQQVRDLTSLPICVSAIDPLALAQSVAAGADLVEIGNYDPFYAQGESFSAARILDLTRSTRTLLPHTVLTVTVPHTLPLDQQADLAQNLVQAGADLIQTEGGTSAQPSHSGTLGLMEKALPTLAAAYEIARAVAVPVLCASGLSSVTAPLAIAAGAAGVGVGSAINRLDDELAMATVVRSLVQALAVRVPTPCE